MSIFHKVATIFFGPEPSSPIYNGSPNWATFLGFNHMLPEVPVIDLIGLFIGYPHTHGDSQDLMELNYFRFAGLPLSMKPIRVYDADENVYRRGMCSYIYKSDFYKPLFCKYYNKHPHYKIPYLGMQHRRIREVIESIEDDPRPDIIEARYRVPSAMYMEPAYQFPWAMSGMHS
jgi:hypothetical protein